MAGSLKDMIYTADDGTEFFTLIDESNGIAGGFADVEIAGVPAIQLPRGLQMRYVNVINVAGTRRKRLWIGTATNDLFTGVQSVIGLDGEDFTVSSSRGEKRRRARNVDTGLTDATAG